MVRMNWGALSRFVGLVVTVVGAGACGGPTAPRDGGPDAMDATDGAVASGDVGQDSPMPADAVSDLPYDAGMAADATGDGAMPGCGALGFVGPRLLRVSSPVVGNTILTADFNRDGNPDLLFGSQSGTINVLLGKGDGTASEAPSQGADAGQGTFALGAVVSGDWNGDGNVDIAVTDSDAVRVRLGDGTGAFVNQGTNAVGRYPTALVAGDWNGDGRLDLAVTLSALSSTMTSLTGSLVLLMGVGDGLFTAGNIYSIPGGIQSMAAADLNGDKTADLAIAGLSYSGVDTGVFVLFGGGNGTFQPAVSKTSSGYVVSAADLNGDGKVDLAVGSQTAGTSVGVLLANGDGSFQAWTDHPTDGIYPDSVVTADWNGDGKLDLGAAGITQSDPTLRAHRALSVRLGNGDGTFRSAASLYLGSREASLTPSPLAAVDFNRDRKVDLAAPIHNGSLSLLLGRADGRFEAAPEYPARGGRASAVGDWNKDRKLDLAVGTLDFAGPTPSVGTNQVSTYLGNGDGTLAPPVHYPVEQPQAGNGTPRGMTAGDWNGDGNVDLAVPMMVDQAVGILIGNGDGSFRQVTRFPTVSRVLGVAAADFDGDHDLDLVTANEAGNSFGLMLGDGIGSFQAQTNVYATGRETAAVIVADWNGDGIPDVATANRVEGTISVWLGLGRAGDRLFAGRVDYQSGRGTQALTSGDWNRDGRPDLAAANYDDDFITILIGNGDGTFQRGVRRMFAPQGSITSGDFDGDGKSDLAITTLTRGTGHGSFEILAGNGDGTFLDSVVIDAGDRPESVVAGDWNGDGRLDVAVTDAASNRLLLLTGTCR